MKPRSSGANRCGNGESDRPVAGDITKDTLAYGVRTMQANGRVGKPWVRVWRRRQCRRGA
ncbi:hypothetical protein Xcc3_33670 [Xanthomonas campestris pv. campestris]|nr:hypothetical protein Xcc1_32970 [Xanthomonas campestris pv. campestris]BBK02060.1 hypothetical protein Xcc3_33670 [Xanthomonas campestris pv. campestris]